MLTLPWPQYIPFPSETEAGNVIHESSTLDAADEKIAFIFRAPKAGNIDRIEFRTSTVTTGATVDARLETVDDTTGAPTGTLVGTNTNMSLVIADTDDNTWFPKDATEFTAEAAVTANQLLAAVIVNPSVSPGNLQISSFVFGGNFSYVNMFTTSWGKVQTVCPCLAVRYSDGSYAYIPRVWPVVTGSTVALNTGTTPDEVGNIFQLPFAARVSGMWVRLIITTTSADCEVVLYDSDGTTALATRAFDANVAGGTGGGNVHLMFDSPVTLKANTNYRLVIKPTTANSLSVSLLGVNALAIMDAMPGGRNMYRTQRTNAGSWTETTTEWMNMGLIIDAIDYGVGPQIMRAGHPGFVPIF